MNRDSSKSRTPDARLRRQARLTRPDEYRRVFSKPVRSGDGCFSVFARINGGQEARLGLAISKKCARRAVERNRLKRIVRESFRSNRHCLSGLDVVVMCRPGALETTNSSLADSIAGHWESIRDQLCASC